MEVHDQKRAAFSIGYDCGPTAGVFGFLRKLRVGKSKLCN
jgi:hypothetical protein